MTREEIEQAIENGESVWYPKNRTIKQIDLKNTHPRTVDEIIINSRGIEIHSERTSENDSNFYGYIGETVFLTKQEAEEKLKEIRGNE